MLFSTFAKPIYMTVTAISYLKEIFVLTSSLYKRFVFRSHLNACFNIKLSGRGLAPRRRKKLK